MRVPATDSSNEVDINTLPQELVRKVVMVAGGDSAVYGSGAVAGVVNFILNNHFNGVKLIAQGGISAYGDDASHKLGVIAGTDVFGHRGHIEFSAQQYVSSGIPNDFARPYGKLVPMELGLGTPTDPYYLATNVRNTAFTPGGYIGSGPLANMTFISNGVLAPFDSGAPG
ncbi:TonB-dependent receptor-like protein, partial [mine drainage metagenome]